MASRIGLKSLDHLVLTVANIPRSVEFYTKILGMKHEKFDSEMNPGVERHAVVFNRQKINLHQRGSEFVPHAQNVQVGSGDLCFLSDTPAEEVLATFKDAGIEVLEGGKVVNRTGAVGALRSVYVRDPDGNLIEVSNLAPS